MRSVTQHDLLQDENDDDGELRGPGEASTSGRANGAAVSNGAPNLSCAAIQADALSNLALLFASSRPKCYMVLHALHNPFKTFRRHDSWAWLFFPPQRIGGRPFQKWTYFLVILPLDLPLSVDQGAACWTRG